MTLSFTWHNPIVRTIIVTFLCGLFLLPLTFAPVTVDAQGTEPPAGETTSGSGIAEQNMEGRTNWFLSLAWNFVAKLIYLFFVAIPVYIASLAGILFNATLLNLVVGMGELINRDTGIGTAINNLWTVIRDVMNILFIFGLIYIGLKTIWDADNANTRRTLGLLIAAALLINFSLFISKAVVDFTNLAAVEICDLMSCRAGPTAIGDLRFSGLSGALFEATGVSTLVSQRELQTGTAGETIATEVLWMFMVMVLFFVLAVVFIGGAIMLFTRFIALILYMIFSPIMFLGWILPSFKRYQDQWWNGFFQKAFFAPLFLFMLYVSLITIRQMRAGISPGANYNGAINATDAGAFSIILVYGFAIGMLVASIVVAQRFSITGAGVTMGGLNSLKAFAYRNTGGRLSGGYRNIIDRLDAAAQRSNEEGGSFTRRRLAEIGRTAITAPAGGTMNARAYAERGARYGAGGTSRADVKSFNEQSRSRADSANAVAGLRAAFGQVNDPDPAVRDAARERIRSATAKQLSDLAKTDGGRQLITTNAGQLSKNQIKSLRNSKDEHISEDFKNQLRDRDRAADLNDLVGNGRNGELADLRNATKDQLGSIGYDTLVEPRNAARLTKKNLDNLNELRGDGELEPDQIRNIRDARRNAHLAIASGNNNQIGSSMTRDDLLANADATAELHEDVILALASDLTANHIRKIAEKVDTNHHQRIRQAYERNGVPPQQPAQRGADGQYIANSPAEQKWMFLHRDPVGTNFGTA